MRKLKKPNPMELTEEEFNNLMNVAPEKEYKEPKTWTIITALDRVLELAEDSGLSDEFRESCKNLIAFLCKELRMTKIQEVMLAILIE